MPGDRIRVDFKMVVLIRKMGEKNNDRLHVVKYGMTLVFQGMLIRAKCRKGRQRKTNKILKHNNNTKCPWR